jgi:hypothetical protein
MRFIELYSKRFLIINKVFIKGTREGGGGDKLIINIKK